MAQRRHRPVLHPSAGPGPGVGGRASPGIPLG